jgi:hypothetical protein
MKNLGKNNELDINRSISISSYRDRVLVSIWWRRMNQKFGDLFQKLLAVFFVWTVIAFIFNIGW